MFPLSENNVLIFHLGQFLLRDLLDFTYDTEILHIKLHLNIQMHTVKQNQICRSKYFEVFLCVKSWILF